MRRKSTKSFNDILILKIKIYEIIGIKWFKNFLLLIESIKHKNNVNYHFANISITSCKKFSGYLIYNTFIHLLSLLIVLVCAFLSIYLKMYYFWIEILFVLLFLFNVYCILLQRYTYLKILLVVNKAKKIRNKQIEKYSKKILPILQNKNKEELIEENDMLLKINSVVKNGTTIVFSDSDLTLLRRLGEIVNTINLFPHITSNKLMNNLTFSQLMKETKYNTKVDSKVEKRVSKLQDLLKINKKNNVLFNFTFITNSHECEEAICSLFPILKRDEIEFTLDLLIESYRRKLTIDV